jgi:hypothetical protein
MSAARGEVVGADDAGAALDAALAADVAGWRELGDLVRPGRGDGRRRVDVVNRGRLRERELVQKRRIGCGELERHRRPGVVDPDAGDQVALRRSARRRAVDPR